MQIRLKGCIDWIPKNMPSTKKIVPKNKKSIALRGGWKSMRYRALSSATPLRNPFSILSLPSIEVKFSGISRLIIPSLLLRLVLCLLLFRGEERAHPGQAIASHDERSSDDGFATGDDTIATAFLVFARIGIENVILTGPGEP